MVDKNRLARAYGWLTLEIWFLIALGGGVRAMNAGLACPDWPLCFGDVIPDYHPQVYLEFIHRAMAGLVSVASLVLAILLWRNSQISRGLKWLAVGSLVLLAAQVVLGGLTVLLLLHEHVVLGHLMLAAGFLGLNLWIYLSLKQEHQSVSKTPVQLATAPLEVQNVSRGYAYASLLVLVCVVGQMSLGGMVASNYAALVCSEFPLCHGQFIPTLSGALGLHIIHRLGAYITAIVIVLLGVWSWRAQVDHKIKKNMMWMITVLVWQMGVGIANVLFYTPPLITVIHLASGMALLGLALRHVFLIRSKLIYAETNNHPELQLRRQTPVKPVGVSG